MHRREYRFDEEFDKRAWGEGPWLSEPDKVVWVDDASGFDCMIVRNAVGVFCGYVGVPPRHPWHRQHYDAVNAFAHGGLTFAGPCQPADVEDSPTVCHNPTGRPDDVWWVGFDCAHAFDLAPSHLAIRGMEPFPGDVYRDLDYVTKEVEDLAWQALAAAHAKDPDRSRGLFRL